jgi:hypothetical protein
LALVDELIACGQTGHTGGRQAVEQPLLGVQALEQSA